MMTISRTAPIEKIQRFFLYQGRWDLAYAFDAAASAFGSRGCSGLGSSGTGDSFPPNEWNAPNGNRVRVRDPTLGVCRPLVRCPAALRPVTWPYCRFRFIGQDSPGREARAPTMSATNRDHGGRMLLVQSMEAHMLSTRDQEIVLAR